MSRQTKSVKRPPRVSGFILLSMGLLMIFAEHGSVDLLWPVLIILAGIGLMVNYAFGRRDETDPIGPSTAPPVGPPPPPPPPGSNG